MPALLHHRVSALVLACLACSGQEPPTFRATTSLIEFTIVVLDSKGDPVTDLKKEQISITEKGRLREVVFFHFEGGTEEASLRKPLPLGMFSNRSEVTPGPPRNVTAIVLDTLNTTPADQVWVRAQVMRYLRALAPNTRVALYALGNQMAVLHDFIDDADSLRERIAKIGTKLQMQSTSDIEQMTREAGHLLEAVPPREAKTMEQMLTRQIENDMLQNQVARERRTTQTLASLEALGNHLAGIPGRKNVVWIGGGISMLSVSGAMGMGPRGDIKSYERSVQQTSERLAHQGIALYVVDARGLRTAFQTSAETGGQLPEGQPNVFERQQQASRMSGDPLPAMYKMAGVTGGRVITDSNDPADGMKAVAGDLRGAYSVAFYASGEPDNKWHDVSVKVKGRRVKLLYRKGYMSMIAAAAPRNWTTVEWLAAVRNPLGSSALRLDAYCEMEAAHGIPNIRTVLHVYAKDLYFQKLDSQLGSNVEIGLVEKTPAGELTIRRSSATIPDEMAKESARAVVSYTHVWKIAPGTSMVRLIVRDRLTGKYGTLDLPVKSIPGGTTLPYGRGAVHPDSAEPDHKRAVFDISPRAR